MPDSSDQLTLDSPMAQIPPATWPSAATGGRDLSRLSIHGEPPSAAILRSLALGAVAGMRSMTPLALLAVAAQSPDAPVTHALGHLGVPRQARSSGSLIGFTLAAVGELVADKLPFTPARIKPASLAWRSALGAAAGAVASAVAGGSATQGARRGAVAAIAAAYAGYFARTRLSRRTGVPDPVWAAAEDAIALALGVVALLPSLEPSLRSLFASLRRGNDADDGR
jgi:uncharacterized membrane protein